MLSTINWTITIFVGERKQLMWGGRGNAIANILDSTFQLLDGENQKDDFWTFSATTRRERARVNDQPDNDNLR